MADREGGSSPALFRASLCGPGQLGTPRRGSQAEAAFASLSCGLHPVPGRAARKLGIGPQNHGGESPEVAAKHTLGCEALGEAIVRVTWRVTGTAGHARGSDNSDRSGA